MIRRAFIQTALILAAAASCGAAEWWNRSWTVRREVEAPSGGTAMSGRDLCTVAFFRGGKGQPRLGDLRVASAKGATRHKVVQGGPGDFCRIVFELQPGETRYWIYYGNPKARPPDTSWKMERGLLLETRRFRGGNPNKLKNMRSLVAKAQPKLGADFVDGVFHGFNLFGESENYVSIYTGVIYAAQAGEYTWVTSSDDASFMLVDGKVVASWPGWHGASGRARPHMRGKTRLEKGLHAFEYLHVNGTGAGIAAAYWQPPSGKKIVPIPKGTFPSVSRGKIKSLEIHGQRDVADYSVTVIDQTFLAGRYLARYRFKDASRFASVGATYTWDFGDGTTATGKTADHVFLADGLYDVKLTVAVPGRSVEIANSIRAQRPWRRQADRRLAPLRDFLAIMRGYDLKSLRPDGLQALFEIHTARERSRDAGAVAEAAVARPDRMPPEFYFDAVMFRQKQLRESGKAEEAVALLRSAEGRLAAKKNLRAKVIREIGDVLFYFMEDLNGALKEYDKVVGRYQGLEDNIVRVTKIKIGDIYRKKGDFEKAQASYRSAEKLRLYKHTDEARRMRKGMLAHSVEDYLRRGQLDEAEKMLSTWEWEFPMEKLMGRSTLLRARIALARKNNEEAAKQLDDFIRVSPGSEYAPECIFIAAAAHVKLGRPDIARKYYERLAKDYRDSEYAVPAASKLKEMGPAPGGEK